MKTSKATPWMLGTALLSVVVLALAWFLVISPELDAASEANDQAEQARERNDLLEIQIAALAEDFENLDAYKEDLAALQAQLPTTVDQAAFNRELAAAAVASNAFVVEVTSGTAVPVVAAATASAPATTGGGPAGTFAVPVTVTVLGDPFEVTAYVRALQQEATRAFLVTGISLAGQEAAGASGGKPEILDGDAEVTISGYIYVLDPASAAVVPADAAQTAPATAN